MTYLIFQRASTEVTQGQFESTGAPLEVDLQGDEGVRSSRCRRGHDEGRSVFNWVPGQRDGL